MRLITHNMLQCHVKDCKSNNFPLQLSNVEIIIQETEFNPMFLRNMLPKLEWNALVKTALQVIYFLFFFFQKRQFIIYIHIIFYLFILFIYLFIFFEYLISF